MRIPVITVTEANYILGVLSEIKGNADDSDYLVDISEEIDECISIIEGGVEAHYKSMDT